MTSTTPLQLFTFTWGQEYNDTAGELVVAANTFEDALELARDELFGTHIIGEVEEFEGSWSFSHGYPPITPNTPAAHTNSIHIDVEATSAPPHVRRGILPNP